jgi:predicted ATPase
MLTRLKVNGFKNLVDVDVRFGPFTCVAGVNGVGKSNLFDAIRFLSAVADCPLLEAAKSVRDESGRTGDVRSLFHRVGDRYDDSMSFAAEMIIPHQGFDDLGQSAEAGITFLRYVLGLAYREDEASGVSPTLEVTEERLTHINITDARKHLLFEHDRKWQKSALRGRRTSPFITTEGEPPNRVIRLHQEGRSGRPLARPAANLPRTVLSIVNSADSPTALLARREMQSWRLLQLEPSALRRPDELTAPTKLGWDGAHLPATLYHVARANGRNGVRALDHDAEAAYSQVANHLAELISDVREVHIEKDERRGLLTLQVTDQNGTCHPARALSDGTLRFLALAVLQLDPETRGVICLEEPENGIHPERIPAMLRLLQDICTDVDAEVGPENPLRQVIINTHSPTLVAHVPVESVLWAESKETLRGGRRFHRVSFSCLPDTWRVTETPEAERPSVVPLGAVLAFLNPAGAPETRVGSDGSPETRKGRGQPTRPRRRRVIDHPDIGPFLWDEAG